MFLSQGPWTPWQMTAYGTGGFLAGLLYGKPGRTRNPIALDIFGFVIIVAVVGPLLDSCTIFTTLSTISPETILFTLAQGFVPNVTHGAACGLTLLLFSRPLLDNLDRLKTKYGMMDTS